MNFFRKSMEVWIQSQFEFTASNFRHCLVSVLSVLSVFCLVLGGGTNAYARDLPIHEVTADADDFALREALLSGNLEEFDHYLSLGANPTEWLDDSQYGWVFCAATEQGREEFLRLLIDKGYDVNFQQVDISSSISLPLTCAIRFKNLLALDFLVAAEADPAVALSIKTPNRIPMSVMSQAIIIGRYELAVWLFDKGNYTDEQLRSDIRMLEKFPVDESAPGNTYRLILADLFRERGYQINPWTRGKSPDK